MAGQTSEFAPLWRGKLVSLPFCGGANWRVCPAVLGQTGEFALGSSGKSLGGLWSPGSGIIWALLQSSGIIWEVSGRSLAGLWEGSGGPGRALEGSGVICGHLGFGGNYCNTFLLKCKSFLSAFYEVLLKHRLPSTVNYNRERSPV